MRALALATLLLSVGCVTTARAPRTRPEVDSSRPDVAPAAPEVLVFSPFTLNGLPGGVRYVVQEPSQEASGGLINAAYGDLALATGALEAALFDAAWKPLPAAEVQRLALSNRAAVPLRELADRGGGSVDEAAIILARAAQVDRIVIVRRWLLGWRAAPVLSAADKDLCAAAAVLEFSVHDKTGRLLWRGNARTTATDVADLELEHRSFSATVGRPPDLSCLTDRTQGCARCVITPETWSELEARLLREASRSLVSAFAGATAPVRRPD